MIRADILFEYSDVGGKKYSIWPEWTEAEIAAEKFDLGGGKGKDKGKASHCLTVNDDHSFLWNINVCITNMLN